MISVIQQISAKTCKSVATGDYGGGLSAGKLNEYGAYVCRRRVYVALNLR